MSYKNPLNLRIGQRVRANFNCIFEYQEDERVVVKEPLTETVTIIGTCIKCTGTYDKGFSHPIDPENYEPATFKANKRIVLYEAKITLEGKTLFIDPGDVNEIHFRNHR